MFEGLVWVIEVEARTIGFCASSSNRNRSADIQQSSRDGEKALGGYRRGVVVSRKGCRRFGLRG